MSLTIAGNRVALACRDYDAAALNPPLDTPDPTADERAALKLTLKQLARHLPFDVLEDFVGAITAECWTPVEATDGPPLAAESVVITEDDGETD